MFDDLMAVLKEMVGLKVIRGFRGVIDFYYCRGVPCARRWPKKPSHIRAPAVREQWTAFKEAAELWKQLSPEVIQAYEDMAQPSNLTGRDMFFRGYISGTLRYYVPVDELEES